MQDIYNDISELKILNNSDTPMVPYININDDKISDYVVQQTVTDDLKFKYEHEKWSYKDNVKLLEFLCTKDSGWKFSDDDVQEIRNYLNKDVSDKDIRIKCYEFGVEYDNEQNNDVPMT